jgi:hypothetical protein
MMTVKQRRAMIGQVTTGLTRVWANAHTQVIAKERDLEAVENGPFPSGAEARALCDAGRRLLATPAGREDILDALTVFSRSVKWAGPETIDRDGFLAELLERLEEHQYSAVVIHRAVRQITEDYHAPQDGEWSASLPRIIKTCDSTQTGLWAAIRFLEAPASEQTAFAYEIWMSDEADRPAARRAVARRLAHKEHRRRLGDDPAPAVSTKWVVNGRRIEKSEVATLGPSQATLAAAPPAQRLPRPRRPSTTAEPPKRSTK